MVGGLILLHIESGMQAQHFENVAFPALRDSWPLIKEIKLMQKTSTYSEESFSSWTDIFQSIFRQQYLLHDECGNRSG